MASSLSGQTASDYIQAGYPFLGVELHTEGKYPYVVYWHDERHQMEYIVFVKILGDYEDVARATDWMRARATRECREVEYPLDFEIEVRDGE